LQPFMSLLFALKNSSCLIRYIHLSGRFSVFYFIHQILPHPKAIMNIFEL